MVAAIGRVPRPLVWLVLGVVVVTPWVSVARQLSNARPAGQSSLEPSGVAWGDRVFTSRRALGTWLHSRGTSYRAWARSHPQARSIFEPGHPATRVAPRPKPRPPAEAARPAKSKSPKPSATHVTAASRTSVVRPGASLLHVVGLIALLVVAALAIAAGVVPPYELWRLRLVSGPVPAEIRVAAVAAGITISIVVAAVSALG
jgi:hypothetical protein